MKKFLEEFKNFAIRGNMIDMAVGIIIGTAFSNVVNSLVKQIILPPLSLLTDGVHLSDRKWVLRKASESSEEVAIGYGAFLEVMLDFFIVAFCIFLVLKVMNRFRNKAEDPNNMEVETPKNIQLLSNIEQLMQEQNQLLKQNSKNIN